MILGQWFKDWMIVLIITCLFSWVLVAVITEHDTLEKMLPEFVCVWLGLLAMTGIIMVASMVI